jgi:hypothetical protein
MAGKNTKSTTVATSSTIKQEVRERLRVLIPQHFSKTLGQIPDVINLVMALIQRESSFNVENSIGIMYSASHLGRYLAWPAIANAYRSGGVVERANIVNGARAYGLMQCTGYYIIKGASIGGKCELARIRNDVCGPFLISPGGNIASKLTGKSNLDIQLLAGLTVLEDKYLNVAPGLVQKKMFADRTTASFAAYLGLGASDGLGTTPQNYANSIIRGSAYARANSGNGPDNTPLVGGSGTAVANTGTNNVGPEITLASGKNLGPAGC